MSGTNRARSNIDEESRESNRASFKCDNRFRSNMQKSRALLPVFLTICGGSETSDASEFMSVVKFPQRRGRNKMAPVGRSWDSDPMLGCSEVYRRGLVVTNMGKTST